MKPVDLVRKLRREAAFEPAALDRGKAVLMAAIRQEIEPTRGLTIVPQVPYENVSAAPSFLERAFGFREIPTARLVSADGGKSGGIESQYISVYVDDVDAHYQRAVAAGARIANGLRDYVCGDRPYEAHRTYEALDPEGHRWRFHQLLREVPQSERRSGPGED